MVGLFYTHIQYSWPSVSTVVHLGIQRADTLKGVEHLPTLLSMGVLGPRLHGYRGWQYITYFLHFWGTVFCCIFSGCIMLTWLLYLFFKDVKRHGMYIQPMFLSWQYCSIEPGTPVSFHVPEILWWHCVFLCLEYKICLDYVPTSQLFFAATVLICYYGAMVLITDLHYSLYHM